MHIDYVTAFIGIGANLGQAMVTVRAAMSDLATIAATQVVAASDLYLTKPIDSSGPDYVNAVAQVRTRLSAPELLLQLQRLENAAGRQRPYANAPRTLDLDILLYGEGRIYSPTLTVPHPRMYARAFVLQPLAQIAPHWVSVEQLLLVQHQACEAIA